MDQASLFIGGGKPFQHQPPEQARQHADRQEEAVAARDEPLPVERKAAAGHDHVHMSAEHQV